MSGGLTVSVYQYYDTPMQPIHIDAKSPVPIWSQIEQQIRLLVARGALTAGAPVPSVRELARDLVVNPATVSKAYQRLTEMEVLEVRRGQGTFVAAGAPVTNQLAEREAEKAARELVAVAKAAGLNLGETRALLTDSWRSLRTPVAIKSAAAQKDTSQKPRRKTPNG